MPPKHNFSDSMVYKLIKEIKTHPCIWNTEIETYSDRWQLAMAWREISQKLKVSDEILRVKWKNIRDTFKREIKKYECQSVDDYAGKWQFFQAMTFMHKPGDNIVVEIEEETDTQSDRVSEDQRPVESIVKMEAVDEPVIEYLDDFDVEVCPIPEKRRRVGNDDEYDLMFLKSLAPYFRELDPIRKLVLRSKIQDMLLNEIAAQTSINKNTSRKA